MKILIAPDKFKGSLSAKEVCQAIAGGLKKQGKTIEVVAHPMADGGDGSLEVLSDYLDLTSQTVETIDPLGRKISAHYFTSSDAAFIEVASASGFTLLKKEERNPLQTSTYGTGEMIADAISKGFQHIYLFLGGSATNDAGIGIAAALGYQFLDAQERILQPIGASLPLIKHIRYATTLDLTNVEMTLLCDVTNPLFGENGAAYIYAPQKGATPEQVKYLDSGLKNFSGLIHQQFGIDISHLPGGGAAGGIGAGLTALFQAKMEKGFAVFAQLTKLEKQIEQADWVISGEGRLDLQSLQGKVIDGIAGLCQKHQKPLVLFVGKNDLSPAEIEILQARSIFSISDKAKNVDDAMRNGAVYLEKMAKSMLL